MAISAEDLLATSEVEKAFAELANTVRQEPSVARHRIFLFQLQCIRGKWGSALSQLKVLLELDDAYEMLVKTYAAVIACEQMRERVFAGELSPHVLGEPSEWIALLAHGVGQLGRKADDAGIRSIDEAYELAEATSGTIDGNRFEWIADGDMRIGPVFELFVDGKYYWVQSDRICSIEFEPISDLRDKVWRSAKIQWSNGGDSYGFMPSRYPHHSEPSSERELLGAVTQWHPLTDDFFIGKGQKVLCTDSAEYSVLDVSLINFD